MWFTMIWNYIKDPKNIIITVLAVALVASVLFGLSQYVVKNIKDASLNRAKQEIEAQKQMIENQEARIKEFTENLKQIKIAQVKLATIRTQSQRIERNIEEANNEKALVDARNDIVDLLYNGLRDQPAAEAN